jgi:uncharacterized protein (DUF983 family)
MTTAPIGVALRLVVTANGQLIPMEGAPVRRRPWDGHCPECGCDRVPVFHVWPDKLRRACAECGHDWSEPVAAPEFLLVGLRR